jgi:hypothetical protein
MAEYGEPPPGSIGNKVSCYLEVREVHLIDVRYRAMAPLEDGILSPVIANRHIVKTNSVNMAGPGSRTDDRNSVGPYELQSPIHKVIGISSRTSSIFERYGFYLHTAERINADRPGRADDVIVVVQDLLMFGGAICGAIIERVLPGPHS